MDGIITDAPESPSPCEVREGLIQTCQIADLGVASELCAFALNAHKALAGMVTETMAKWRVGADSLNDFDLEPGVQHRNNGTGRMSITETNGQHRCQKYRRYIVVPKSPEH